MCKYVVIMPKNRIGILAKNAFEIKMKQFYNENKDEQRNGAGKQHMPLLIL